MRAGPLLRSALVAAAENVPGRIAEIAGLVIEVVRARNQRRIWNTLLAQEHPHGVTTFAGHQVRYPVCSRHGYLGAVAFAAAALQLAARKRWMGWTDVQRQAHLERVVCLSRILIRPGVRCASARSRCRQPARQANRRRCPQCTSVETIPPAEEKPVQWFLLTSIDIDNVGTAADIVGHYLQRLRIEDFFRGVKSGCKTEFLLFRTADRLQRAIPINAVIAWRIMVIALLGRQVPECEAELMFTDHELAFLREYAAQAGLALPDNLGKSVQLVAHLGGDRGRKQDPEPEIQIMWQGYRTVTTATIGHRIGAEAGQQRGLEAGKRYMLEQVKKHVA